MRLTMIILLLLGCCSTAAAQTAYRLTSLDWPPYTGAELEHQGSITQTLRDALTADELELDVRFLPWNRAVKMVRDGDDYIGYFPEYISRKTNCLYSRPLDISPLGLAYRSDTELTWSELRDLAGYRIGVVDGYLNTPEFDHLAETGILSVEKTLSDRQNLLKLLYRRIDLAVIDRRVMEYWMQTSAELEAGRGELLFHDQLLAQNSLHVCFSNSPAGRAALQHLERLLPVSETALAPSAKAAPATP